MDGSCKTMSKNWKKFCKKLCRMYGKHQFVSSVLDQPIFHTTIFTVKKVESTHLHTYLSTFISANTLAREFSYELVYISDESKRILEKIVAISLVKKDKDAATGLVKLLFNAIFRPERPLTWVGLSIFESWIQDVVSSPSVKYLETLAKNLANSWNPW